MQRLRKRTIRPLQLVARLTPPLIKHLELHQRGSKIAAGLLDRLHGGLKVSRSV